MHTYVQWILAYLNSLGPEPVHLYTELHLNTLTKIQNAHLNKIL